MTAPAEPADTGTGKRVLLVEDQWLIAMDLADQLRDSGYIVVGPASSLEKALALIETEAINAGLLDINLNGTMSYPAAQALARKGIAFAFLSGHTSAELHEDFRDQRLLCKPITSNELMTTVEALLRE
jgi:DNA-binding response OmpR family regulator